MAIVHTRDPEWNEPRSRDLSSPAELDLRRIVRGVIRRRWLVASGAVLLGGAAALAVHFLVRDVYVAQARFLVRDSRSLYEGTPLAGSVGVLDRLDAVEEMLRVEPLMEQAGRTLSMPAERVDKAIELEAVTGANVILVNARSTHATLAAEIANVVTNAFIAQEHRKVDVRMADAKEALDQRVAEAQSRVSATQGALTDFIRKRGFYDDSQLETLASRTIDLEQRIDVLKAALKASKEKLQLVEDRLGKEEKYLRSESVVAAGPAAQADVRLRLTRMKEALASGLSREEAKKVAAADTTAASAGARTASIGPNPVHQTLYLAGIDHESEALTQEAELATLETLLLDLREKQALFPELERTFNGLQVQKEFALTELRDSLAAASTLDRAQRMPNSMYEVVSEASPPSKPERSRRTVFFALAGMVGLFGALGMAVLAELVDTRIRIGRDLEQLGLVVLASVPDIKRSPDGYAEGVRQAAFWIRHRSVLLGPQALLITSPRAGDGKTKLSRTLSHVITEWGDTVLRVDANLRARTKTAPLLESYLTGDAERPLIRKTGDGVSTVTCAGGRPDAPALIASDRMRSLVRNSHGLFRHVLIDSPAVLPSVDAELLAEQADGVVLVVAAYRTPRDDVAEAVKRLRATGTPLLGAVLMGADLHSARKEAAL